MSIIPQIITGRLVLRSLTCDDAVAIAALRSDDIVNRYLDRPKSVTIAEASTFIEKIISGLLNNDWFYWAIALKGNNELIGTICLWNNSDDKSTIETGFELISAYHGKGYMQEALTAVTNYAFQSAGFNRLLAYTHQENQKSIALLEKNGFKRGEFVEPESNEVDLAVYALAQNKSPEITAVNLLM